MSGKYMLDTNIVIALIAEDPSVQKHIAKAEEVYPGHCYWRTFFWCFQVRTAKENSAHIEKFTASNTVLACDIGTSWEYGRIKNILQKKGCPIPENDIWTADLAMEHGLTLISRDEHFKNIDELKRATW